MTSWWCVGFLTYLVQEGYWLVTHDRHSYKVIRHKRKLADFVGGWISFVFPLHFLCISPVGLPIFSLYFSLNFPYIPSCISPIFLPVFPSCVSPTNYWLMTDSPPRSADSKFGWLTDCWHLGVCFLYLVFHWIQTLSISYLYLKVYTIRIKLMIFWLKDIVWRH